MAGEEPLDAADRVLAPVDYLAVGFRGGQVDGSALLRLRELVNQQVIDILDVEILAKASAETVVKVPIADVTADLDIGLDLRAWQGSDVGLLDALDIDVIARSMEPDSLALIVVFENVWACRLLDGVEAHGGYVLGSGSVDPQDLIERLDVLDGA